MNRGPKAPGEKENLLKEMQKLESEDNLNRRQISQRLGCSEATVTRYLGAKHPYGPRRIKLETDAPQEA